MRLTTLLTLALLLPATPSLKAEEEVFWKESFDAPGVGIAAYPNAEKGTLKYETDSEGRSFLRIAPAPGEETTGITLTHTELPDNGLLEINATVRGDGPLMMTLMSLHGRLHSSPITLKQEWQPLREAKTLGFDERTLTLYLHRPPGTPAGGIIEIDEIRIITEPPLPTRDVAVPPRRFLAADYPKSLPQVIEHEGKRGVGGLEPFVIAGLPVPMTSRPLTLYAKIKPGSTGDRYELCGRRTGKSQSIRTVTPKAEGWQWIRFTHLSAQECGESVHLQGWFKSGPLQPAIITDLIWSTEADLSPDQLDNVQP